VVIALSGLLRITDSDYPFGIFKLFLSFCTFSFSHCIVWPSSIYGFWLPLWYLQSLLVLFPLVIALSCLLRIIDSDYPFGTFKLFLSFCSFSFGHCIVCSSSIYAYSLPLWYLQTRLTGIDIHYYEGRKNTLKTSFIQYKITDNQPLSLSLCTKSQTINVSLSLSRSLSLSQYKITNNQRLSLSLFARRFSLFK